MISPSPILYAINGNALLCGRLIEKCNVRGLKPRVRSGSTSERGTNATDMPVYNGRFSTKRLQCGCLNGGFEPLASITVCLTSRRTGVDDPPFKRLQCGCLIEKCNVRGSFKVAMVIALQGARDGKQPSAIHEPPGV